MLDSLRYPARLMDGLIRHSCRGRSFCWHFRQRYGIVGGRFLTTRPRVFDNSTAIPVRNEAAETRPVDGPEQICKFRFLHPVDMTAASCAYTEKRPGLSTCAQLRLGSPAAHCHIVSSNRSHQRPQPNCMKLLRTIGPTHANRKQVRGTIRSESRDLRP